MVRAEFVGYYTIYGPFGYVQGRNQAAVEQTVAQLLLANPNAQAGAVRGSWFGFERLGQPEFRATIWSKMELV